MKIVAVSVTRLFGMFDHLVHLNVKEGVTIIHGSNGLGKTALLRLINGVFNGRYSELKSIRFRSFEIEFSDGSFLRISRPLEGLAEASGAGQESSALIAEYFHGPGATPQTTELGGVWKREDARSALRFLEQSGLLERIGPEEWLSRSSGDVFSPDEALERYWEYLPKHLIREMGIPLFAESPSQRPNWFEDIRQ
jgi:ABC-type phosphate/phosphonate transport system ATPase subunit